MEILGLEKVSLVDFEGKICATIFTGGCNFLCPFCHNRGLVKREIEPLSEAEVIDYLQKRRKLLDAVTVSGGEPTLQPDLDRFLGKIKDMGYVVKLDTNGSNPQVLKDLIDKKLIDYVAMDIKNNFDAYSKIVGLKKAPLERIKESLSILHSSKINYELRTTLVEQFHKMSNIEKLAEDLAGEKVLYLQKFVDSGELISDMAMSEVSKSKAEEFKNVLSKTISNVHLRGY